jgi:enoyl-CoA hydratase
VTVVQEQTADGIVTLTLDCGPVNALDSASLRELERALLGSRDCPVVLTGRGRVFCAGFDLTEFGAPAGAAVLRLLDAYERVLVAVLEHPRPVVAAVNGAAVAAGCILALAADARVFAETARLGLPELRLGLPFQALSFEIARTALGRHLARLLHGADRIAVQDIDDLADGVLTPVTEVASAAVERARELAALEPETFLITKRARWYLARRMADETACYDEQIRRRWVGADMPAVLEAAVSGRRHSPGNHP